MLGREDIGVDEVLLKAVYTGKYAREHLGETLEQVPVAFHLALLVGPDVPRPVVVHLDNTLLCFQGQGQCIIHTLKLKLAHFLLLSYHGAAIYADLTSSEGPPS